MSSWAWSAAPGAFRAGKKHTRTGLARPRSFRFDLPGQGGGGLRHHHGLQLAVGVAASGVAQPLGDALVPQCHTLGLHGETVQERVRNGGGELAGADPQVKSKGERVGLAAVEPLARATGQDVAVLEVHVQLLDERVSQAGLDGSLHIRFRDRGFEGVAPVIVARQACLAGAQHEREAGDQEDEQEGITMGG